MSMYYVMIFIHCTKNSKCIQWSCAPRNNLEKGLDDQQEFDEKFLFANIVISSLLDHSMSVTYKCSGP